MQSKKISGFIRHSINLKRPPCHWRGVGVGELVQINKTKKKEGKKRRLSIEEKICFERCFSQNCTAIFIVVSPIFFTSLYALQSFYGCPTIVKLVSTLLKYLFYYTFYREKIKIKQTVCH